MAGQPTFGQRVQTLRKAAGLGQKQLAKKAGVSRPYLSELENDKHPRPGRELVERLAAELGVEVADLLPVHAVSSAASNRGTTALGKTVSNIEDGVVIEQRRGDGAWPIYEWGACGDPLSGEEGGRPIPVDLVDIDREKARVIGARGFGVRIVGESMALWGFHPRDVVWCNPDQGPRLNWPCLALVRQGDGRQGMVVKEYVMRDGVCVLVSAGYTPEGNVDTDELLCEEATVIGPIMRHDPASRVPSRRDIISEQDRLIGRVRRIAGLQPAAG